jgi:hypothetical protein
MDDTVVIISGIISLLILIQLFTYLSQIRNNTRESRFYNQMNTILLKKLLEKQGESIDLKELYLDVRKTKDL